MKITHALAAALAFQTTAQAIDIARYLNAATFEASHSYGMELDRSAAEFEFSELSLFAFLSKPVDLGGDWSAISYLDFRASRINIDGNPLIGGLADDIETDLFRVGVPFMVYHSSDTSRWTYGAWISPAISSDFDHVNSEDFFLDGAIAAAYQVNDCLLVGAGVYVSDALDDIGAIPGVGFVWTPTEDWLISYYGPRFIARYELNDRNQIGLEVASNGGVWNIDGNDRSLKLNLNSWRSGLYYRYNLAGELWIEAGGGMTFANDLELQTRDGLGLFENQLGKAESAPYAYIGLSMARW